MSDSVGDQVPDRKRILHVLLLALMLAAAALVFGAWTSEAANAPPTCTAKDKKLPQHLALEDGYSLACGPGSALVRVQGTTYRIKGSACFRGPTGARLYFGAFNFTNPPQPLSPQDSLYLVVERRAARPVVADVIDGGIDLLTRANVALSGTPAGKAHLDAGFKRGTFAGVGRSGNLDGVRFTGNWNCG